MALTSPFSSNSVTLLPSVHSARKIKNMMDRNTDQFFILIVLSFNASRDQLNHGPLEPFFISTYHIPKKPVNP
jgi:hypothetical protein